MLVPSGPFGGHLKVPSTLKQPKSITFIQCAGSRDENHNPYCSGICCLYTIKNAGLIKKEYPDMEVNICYIDIRTGGRYNEEYYRTLREMGVNFIHGRPSEITTETDPSAASSGKADKKAQGLMVQVFDTTTSKLYKINTDIIVLATALRPSDGTTDMISKAHLVFGPDGFIKPVHIKIAPVDTTVGGIYVVGTASGPKSIPDSISEAGLAASRVATFLKDPEATIDLNKAHIDPEICIKCGTCKENCVYDAVDTTGDVYKILEVSCQGCGKCASICPSGAIDLRSYLDYQIEAQIDGILSSEPDSIIAFVCTQCGYNAADLVGTSRNTYSPKIKIIKYPCTARVSYQHMLYPFSKGAKGVMVVGCLVDQCHYIDGNIGAKERSKSAKAVLDLMGIGSDKLEFFNMSSADGHKFVEACKRMVDQCY